ncbi:MAG: hypothetical protein ACRDG4_21035 [Chloroflexota bacterium]
MPAEERLDNVFETERDALLHLEHQSNYTVETLQQYSGKRWSRQADCPSRIRSGP